MARRFPGRSLFVLFTVALVVATVDRVNRPSRASTQQDAAPGEWRAYGRDPGGTRFSPLTQLTPANVGQLQLAWTYHIGEKERLPNISPDREPPAFEATPLIVGNTLYVVTPSSRMIALDAESGRERWRFDPQAGDAARSYHQHRGAAYWEGDGQNSGPARRLLYGTLHGDLVCLDADTGRVCAGFGVNGRVSLRTRRTGVSQKTLNAMTSAPAIYRDIVIVGTRVQESPAQGPAGVVRAFDVRSGRPLWDFRGIPRSEESGADTWEGSSWRDRSGANVWSTMSVDVERGMVFLPVGSPTYDFFGGDRKGQNLFGNSLVALAARTGRRIWHFQMVHHDIWDYDIPAQPVLATIRRRNRSQDVVVQVTKMGLVFVLDRGDGTPLFPVAERAVPSAGVPGESPWPTQPFPTLPQPLVRHAITRADLSDVTPESAKFCRALFDSVHGGRIYTPMGTEHTLVVPGNLGGANWSGAAFDSRSRRLFVNVNELPLVAALESDQGAMPTISHYRRFVDEQGRPCVKPPWGLRVAIDLDSGSVAWRSPLGNDESVRASRPTGLPSLGGAIATAGGLFSSPARRIAAFAPSMRAMAGSCGRRRWMPAALDASGHATPATYFSDRSRRQFVVIAAGGGGYLSPDRVSDTLAAFALPASPSQ